MMQITLSSRKTQKHFVIRSIIFKMVEKEENLRLYGAYLNFADSNSK